jgi:hypothetical protein
MLIEAASLHGVITGAADAHNVDSSPPVVIIAVNVEDLLALYTEDTGRCQYTPRSAGRPVVTLKARIR